MITGVQASVRNFVTVKQQNKDINEEQKRRREETRQLTLRYLALKESQHETTDGTPEQHADKIMERVHRRMAQRSKHDPEEPE